MRHRVYWCGFAVVAGRVLPRFARPCDPWCDPGGPVLIATWLCEARFVGEDDGLCSVVQVELGVDASDVGLDGRVADDELARDVGVREAAGDEPEDLELARRQFRKRRRIRSGRRAARVALDQSARDRWREQRVA